MLGSQSLVLATTAMVVSSTVLFLAFSRHKSVPQKQPLRSCLCSDRETKKKKEKKKRVKFAVGVKEPGASGPDLKRNIQRRNPTEKSCKECEISSTGPVMPANRAALYSAMLRDRAERTVCSY
ncbi:hypothetical protein SAY86_028602 [Trapa natans]|uniref:Uncharacterized protein n=1 Tax=Trapa natans TaxID=22666 RepID=A0AAN7REB6_TRANT|nr:hypothetical protein SAY86_028602 [Trapa natans]